MNQETGRFENMDGMQKDAREARMAELRETTARLNPQYEPGKHQDPCLGVGEIVDIKGVKFRVTRIKADGKVGLKMLTGDDVRVPA